MQPTMVYYLVKCTNAKCRETKVTAAKDWCKCNICKKYTKVTDTRAERKELTIGGIL
jgi:hypothetical protein